MPDYLFSQERWAGRRLLCPCLLQRRRTYFDLLPSPRHGPPFLPGRGRDFPAPACLPSPALLLMPAMGWAGGLP